MVTKSNTSIPISYLDTDGTLAANSDVKVATQKATKSYVDSVAVASDTIWDAKGDIAAGTAADTAAKLTVGTNGYVLTAASAETTGLKWADPGTVSSPTAKVHIAAGTATANTAPLKLTSGTNLTTPEAGAVEFDGSTIFFTNSTPTRIPLTAPLVATTYGGTTTFDLAVGRVHTVTLTGNPTLALSNVTDRPFSICLKQDGTGSRTVTWFSTIAWAGGVAPTLTTTANKSDLFGFLPIGGGNYLGLVLGQNA